MFFQAKSLEDIDPLASSLKHDNYLRIHTHTHMDSDTFFYYANITSIYLESTLVTHCQGEIHRAFFVCKFR